MCVPSILSLRYRILILLLIVRLRLNDGYGSMRLGEDSDSPLYNINKISKIDPRRTSIDMIAISTPAWS